MYGERRKRNGEIEIERRKKKEKYRTLEVL